MTLPADLGDTPCTRDDPLTTRPSVRPAAVRTEDGITGRTEEHDRWTH
ncbi:hypothetical protein [Streptomyces sp. NPDC001546]